MIYNIIAFLACGGLLLVTLLLARRSGFNDGWLEGYQQAKEEDFDTVFGVKEKK